jgi:hypothetical protein
VANWVPDIKGSSVIAKARAAADAAQRKAAKAVILSPRDVEGEYDAHRVLMTTMGGKVRPLTHDDLAAFRANVRQVRVRYKGGIRARQVLDLSLPEDRQRANAEILSCVAVTATGGRVRFMTNAGPRSDVTHHSVTVDFAGSYTAAASGGAGDAKKSAQWLRRQPLNIECDCGRWRYWYRYIATIGKYNAGRDETGYPKIRNPHLHGVACKHILRVMAEVESSAMVLAFLTRMIDRARAKDDNKAVVRTSQKEAKKMANKPGRKIRDVETTMRARAKARERSVVRRRAAHTPGPKKAGPATRANVRKSAEMLGAQYGLTADQVMALLAAAKK